VAQADRIFDENFLSIRAKLIEVAAILDRIDRAAPAPTSIADRTAPPTTSLVLLDDPRRGRVEEAIGMLLQGATAPGKRAATLQQLFSRPYEADWRERFGL
jgi:hypothetical protein